MCLSISVTSPRVYDIRILCHYSFYIYIFFLKKARAHHESANRRREIKKTHERNEWNPNNHAKYTQFIWCLSAHFYFYAKRFHVCFLLWCVTNVDRVRLLIVGLIVNSTILDDFFSKPGKLKKNDDQQVPTVRQREVMYRISTRADSFFSVRTMIYDGQTQTHTHT